MKEKNPVAKFAHKFNKSIVMKDRKKEADKTAARKPFDKNDVKYRSGDNT